MRCAHNLTSRTLLQNGSEGIQFLKCLSLSEALSGALLWMIKCRRLSYANVALSSFEARL